MKLIVGLGNPGDKYLKNRHNVGYMMVSLLASRYDQDFKLAIGLKSEVAQISANVVLAKPLTFMNSSGEAVQRLMQEYRISIEDLWVIHDDLDIPLGDYKIQKGVGPKIHGGVTSIEGKVSKYFWRLRIGVDARDQDNRIPGEEYVLMDFNNEELIRVNSVMGTAISEIKKII